MRRIHFLLYICLLCTLTSCYSGGDTWFNHRLDFSDNDPGSQLVLSADLCAGSAPQIVVNTAYFIADPDRVDTLCDEYHRPLMSILRYGYLHDADVRIRINGGEWLTLHEDSLLCTRSSGSLLTPTSSGTIYDESHSLLYYYTCDYLLQPLDSVELIARDTAGNEARASLRMPEQVVAQAWMTDASDYQPDESMEGKDIVYFRLSLPSLPATSNLLRVRSLIYGKMTKTWTDNFRPASTSAFFYPFTFSRDWRFDKYSDLCRSMAQGWYGSCVYGLYADAPTAADTLLMAAVVNPESSSESVVLTNGKGESVTYSTSTTSHIDSIVISLDLVTPQTYLYFSSLAHNRLIEYEPYYDFWKTSEANEVEQITSDIEGAFTLLGEMEDYPIYCNISGGYGRVLASSGCRLVLRL